jgi:hypothetical protein
MGLAPAGAANAPGGRSMRTPLEVCRRRVSGRGRDTLGTLGGRPLCQDFDLTILFQEYQEYQPTLHWNPIRITDTLRGPDLNPRQHATAWPLRRHRRQPGAPRCRPPKSGRAIVLAPRTHGLAATKLSGMDKPNAGTNLLLGISRVVRIRRRVTGSPKDNSDHRREPSIFFRAILAEEISKRAI